MASGGAAASRSATKANALYFNENDLLDKMKADPEFDLKKLKDEELPDELKKLKPEERETYLKKKAEERAGYQKQIQELSVKRAKFVEDELKKKPKSDAEQAFDESLRATIRQQAQDKGFEVPPMKK